MYLNFKNIYADAWKDFGKNWGKYVLITILLFCFTFIPLAGGIIQMFMTMLILNAMLKSLRGEEISFGNFFEFKETFDVVAVLYVIAITAFTYFTQYFSETIPVLSAFMAIAEIVLGIILFPLFLVLIDKKLSFVDTFKYAAKLTKGVRFEIILLTLVNFIIALIGVCLFFVGIFVAFPVITIAIAAVYISLEQRLNQETAGL